MYCIKKQYLPSRSLHFLCWHKNEDEAEGQRRTGLLLSALAPASANRGCVGGHYLCKYLTTWALRGGINEVPKEFDSPLGRGDTQWFPAEHPARLPFPCLQKWQLKMCCLLQTCSSANLELKRPLIILGVFTMVEIVWHELKGK